MTFNGFPWADRFVTAVAAWNVFGLPALLAAVLAARWRAETSPGGPARAVRRLGLVHLGMAAWSLTRVVDELWAYRTMGIFPSNPLTGLAGSVRLIAADLPVGLGLRRLRPWSRRFALGLALARLALAGIVLRWTWTYGAALDLTEWPRLAVSYGLPLVALTVLLWPGTAALFRGVPDDAPPRPGGRFPALLCLLTAVLLGSVVVTDAADWAVRAAAEVAEGGLAP